ncbi:MAG TPA: universal stress protein [Candidatus Dormibacteraeota bacterium]|nr:universal stress protein [Candidatus Dormibacteraeota bacterium]
MKILLAIDGLKNGGSPVQELLRRRWEPGTEVRILSVVHPVPLVADPILILAASHVESLKEEQLRASRAVNDAAEQISKGAPELKVSTQVLEGSPKKAIVEEAERWGADLILVGSHGRGRAERFLLGSVAQAVAEHALCSVEIARPPRSAAA